MQFLSCYLKNVKSLILLFTFSFLFSATSFRAGAQCQIQATVCQQNTAGPFTFSNMGPAVSTCLDWIGPNAAYVTLYITSSGPLNLLIDGNASNGFLDVAVFKIPTGVPPCTAIQNTANQIGCNYASNSSGCVQFGTAFSCASSVAAPNVNAGDILMVVVENWSGASSNFTLSLGPGGAQSGSPTPTITSPANFCFRSQPVQLTTNHAGGTWSGPGVSASGLFNPSVAGPGTHTISYTIGVSPCQATTSKVITVSAPLTGVKNVTICQGQSYVFNGISYTSNNNTAKDTFQNAQGCDSIVTLNLTVNPYVTSIKNVTICQGQSYVFNGISYTSNNNTAKDTFQTAAGCDSIVTLNLNVTPAITSTINRTICKGNAYNFGGTNYTSSQNGIQHTFQTPNGCDSIVTLNLTVTPPLTGTQTTNICQGQSYTFNGITYTSSNNTAKDTLQNAQGCDSIVTLNLTVDPYITSIRNVTICQGQAFTFNGITYTSSNNTAKDTFVNQNGCDSIVTLNLVVNPVSTGTQSVTLCQGQSYTFNGITYTSSNNTAKDTLLNQYGCDSIVTLNLIVNPVSAGTQTTTICQGQSYTFNGIAYTSSNNTAKDTLLNQYGCDSVVTLNLTVTPAITNTINPVICQGNSYTFAGTSYTTSQSGVVHTFQTAQGCDSIVTMNLTVNPPLTGTQTSTICQGQSYTFNGIVYTTSNSTAKDTLQNALGCDSVVTLNLTVTPAITNTINPVICQGNSYNFGGTVYTTSQSGIVHNFPTAQGCDSIVTMNLTVNPVTTGTQTTVLCQGQSFTFNGITYTSSNYTAKDTLVNQYGCDSIVTLNLTVNPVSSGTQTVTICQGHSYSFNGITYTAGNTTATDTLVNQYGCDSIVTLNLTVTPAPTTTLNDTICLGASYTFGPHVFTTDQSGFVHNFPTAQGCDSLVTLNLTVLNIVPQPLNITESGCDVVSFEGTDYTSSTIINDTLYSDFGCDSIYRHIEITVHKTVAYELDIDTAGCDEVFVNGIRYTSDAQVRDTLKNQYGCDSVYRDFHIKIYQFQLDLSFTPDDPYEMERIEFTTSSYYGNNYKVLSWSPATAFSDQDAKSQTASFTAPAQVIVRASSLDGGCEDEFLVSIDPREYSKEVAVPNAFSPNGDGLNDIFRPVLKLERAYNTMDFRIYNRYGQLVHATANMNHGWDGMFNGRPADNGMYSYKLVIYFLDGTNKVFTGEVSLVR